MDPSGLGDSDEGVLAPISARQRLYFRQRACWSTPALSNIQPEVEASHALQSVAMEAFLREWRQDALNKAQYDSAIFIGDKLLAITSQSSHASERCPSPCP